MNTRCALVEIKSPLDFPLEEMVTQMRDSRYKVRRSPCDGNQPTFEISWNALMKSAFKSCHTPHESAAAHAVRLRYAQRDLRLQR